MTEQTHFHAWRPHPWHGLVPGRNPPHFLQAYVEITPFDSVKYEIDKETGYLQVNRPQRTSSLPPVLYGFVPRTYCGPRVAALLPGSERGDGDPLDICVLSERPINRSEVLLNVQVVGGLRSADEGEADDKIIAVLEGDAVWGDAMDLSDIPPRLIERLRHYFETYKMTPGGESHVVVQAVYGREDAEKVVLAAMADYEETFGTR
ncbi:MAG: inorganic pyrophosphatase [Anaerolineae bacterium]|nr:inorganic pyrophosphatase [Anaerolineae bacterium]